MTKLECDVAIVGAGPAGMAASTSVPEAKVLLIDDNPWLGGQIWRGIRAEPSNNLSLRTTIYDAPTVGVLLGLQDDQPVQIRYRKLILATGARELFLPFPGWTLPGVMGAGGLQALAKGGLDLNNKRVVVSGSGPLLMAVAYYLRCHRAQVLSLNEQAPLTRLASFGIAAAKAGGKMAEAGRMIAKVGSRIRPGTWVTEAHGTRKLEGVTIMNGSRTWRVQCDYLACSYGLVPNLELAQLLGCKIENGFIVVDEHQRTSVENVFCAGEGTGIGGLEKATHEGIVAGISASDARLEPDWEAELRRAQAKVRGLKPFVRSLDESFRLRDELLKLAREDTIVCRCEDVTLGRLRQMEDARDAKLQTRCGMGPCQGRVCGPATRHLFGWGADTVRPPIVPVPAHCLAREGEAEISS